MSKAISYFDWELSFKKKPILSNEKEEKGETCMGAPTITPELFRKMQNQIRDNWDEIIDEEQFGIMNRFNPQMLLLLQDILKRKGGRGQERY